MTSSMEELLGGLLGGSGGQGALGGILGGLGGGGGGSPLAMLAPVVTGMLAGGGLQKLMGGMQAAGLEDKARSWISSETNKPISADEVKKVVAPAQIADLATKAGVSHDEAAGLIAQALPAAVDHVTPGGTLPDAATVDKALGATAA
jgi:uncharacterized protein YidB (DUF937 family)